MHLTILDVEAAKKKDKDAKPEDDGKPKPVAFGCEAPGTRGGS